MRLPLVAVLSGALFLASVHATPVPERPLYRDPAAPVEARVTDLLGRMTLEEKLSLITGDRYFYIRPIERLGWPEIVMADGPLGVRNYGQSTAYPATIALASSWNPDLAHDFGVALARDSRARGVHILLAPGVNIQRVPTNGRNFEYFSEDPLLSARLGVAVIRGLQENGVVASVKHYAANNQETDRTTIDARVSMRALREIYLPPFHAAVTEAGVWTVMNAYNRLNGPYTTEHVWLNLQVLKGEWAFPGVLMSDWNATHDTLAPFNAGLDLEMPGGAHFTQDKLRPLLASGRISEATLDDKVRRILRMGIANGFLDRPQKDDSIPLDDPRSAAIALEAARQGIVLLRNDRNLLPLDRSHPQRIVVLGPLADLYASGGGSSHVRPFRAVSTLDGLRRLAGPQVRIDHIPDLGLSPANRLLYGTRFAAPLKLEFFANMDLAGTPVQTRSASAINHYWTSAPAPGLGDEKYSARWTGEIEATETGEHTFILQSDDGSRVFLDDQLLIDLWGPHAIETKETRIHLRAGDKHRLRVEFFQDSGDAIARFGWGPTPKEEGLTPEQAERIRTADAVIVSAGFLMAEESEGFDHGFDLPHGQERLIREVSAVNPRTIVVLHTGNRVATAGWIGGVPALLQAWFAGQDGGRALAEIIFGEVNPSAKLPVTYEARWEDNASYGNYPGEHGQVRYAEDIFIGYRWFDHKQLTPLFPFGHGLSYTTFRYANLATEQTPDGRIIARFDLTNTGPRAGAEVAQLYVEPPASTVPRAVRELKGFARVELQPGETKSVTITLEPRAFAYFDEKSESWKTAAGRHAIVVGASSRDLRLRAAVDVPATGRP